MVGDGINDAPVGSKTFTVECFSHSYSRRLCLLRTSGSPWDVEAISPSRARNSFF